MPSTVFVNCRGVVHQGSGGMNTVFPDVCKTPSPGGPVPIPYPNIGNDGVITLKAETYPYRLEAHHIIPVEQVKSTSTLKENAVLAGWDINHISNGMLMPRDEMDVALHLLQQHNGSHPGSYIQPIAEQLECIEQFYENACQDKEDVSMQLGLGQALLLLSNALRGKIVSIRQHASGVDFMGLHLDSLAVFQGAIRTLEDRRQRYMEQQRQQFLDNAQRKTW